MKSHASLNRIYRLVWSQVLNSWVAVAETCRGFGKGGSRKAIAAVAIAALPFGAAQADPTGGQVTSGSATISQSANLTTINQATQNASLSWQTFNVGANQTVNFVQPNSTAVAVNRIYDTNGSQIMGNINANGKVFLINPNGILFGQGAQINVGGLIASTLNMSDESLNSAARSFSGTLTGNGSGTGSIINQGTINTPEGGYVAFLGNTVSNQGTINSPLGTVALGAGSVATLTFDNNNLVQLQIDQSTLNNLAENKQVIKADGGMVLMSAGAKDSLLASVVNNTGVIQAQAAQNKSGKIILMGGMTAGTTNVNGTLDARAPNGGNGGFIETSAANVKIANGAIVTTVAKAGTSGQSGTWLIDPVDFTITAGTALQTTSGMGADTLSANLAGGNVTIATAATTTGNGDIFVDGAVTWNASKLTLKADRNININANLDGTGGAGTAGSLALEYGQAAGNGIIAGVSSDYTINTKAGGVVNLAAGSNFTTKLGSTGTVKNYTVITTLGAQGSVTGADLQGMNGDTTKNYALGGNIANGATTAAWNSNAGFIPVGNKTTSFTGSFDGLGHTITGLVINQPSTVADVGLIGLSNGVDAVIRNIGLIGGSVTGGAGTGGLLGSGDATNVSNSYTTGNVVGGAWVGGLVGNNVSGNISGSYATGNISGTTAVGGLVGNTLTGNFSNSYATGNVHGGAGSGGLVGINTAGNFDNTYATGNVDGFLTAAGAVTPATNMGGLIGSTTTGNISNSYATGDVGMGNPVGAAGAPNIGGLIGMGLTGSITKSYATGNVQGSSNIGGLVGNITTGAISETYALGNVKGSSIIGGLVGMTTGNISDSYAKGFVNNIATSGGLVGDSVGNITNSYAAGTSQGATGGLAGTITGTITNSYWNSEIGPKNSAGIGGVGLSSAAMVNPATFSTTWSPTIWKFDGTNTPILTNLIRTITITAAADNVSKVYDGLFYMGPNTSTYKDPNSVIVTDLTAFGLTGALTYGGAFLTAKDAGSYAIAPSGVTSTNAQYVIAFKDGYLTINPKALNVVATGVYNGTTNVAGFVIDPTSLVGGQTLSATGSAVVANKNVGTGKVIVSDTLVIADGTTGTIGKASNYTLVGGSKTATITQLGSVTWVGGATGNWFNPANWASTADLNITGMVPDLANVANVIIPTGTVVSFNSNTLVAPAEAGVVSVSSITGAGNAGMTMEAGSLNIGTSLQLATLSQIGGTISGNGDVIISNAFSQAGTAAIGMAGNVTITQAAGNLKVSNVSGKNVTLNAAENLALGNVAASGKLALAYGQSSTNGVTAGVTNDYTVSAPINLAAGLNFSTKLGTGGAAVDYTVITTLGAQGDATTSPATTTLQGMAVAANKAGNFVLGANIDNGATTSTWNANKGFTPIGSLTNNFTGKFDGLGHTITGITINQATIPHMGLFGANGDGADIRNVGLIGGSVLGGAGTGGLVGSNTTGNISNSYNTGTVTGGAGTGGLVGTSVSGSISNSYSTGRVIGGAGTGGLLGTVAGATVGGSVSNSYSTSQVNGGFGTGGLVGTMTIGSITNSYATGDVWGAASTGGLLGGISTGTVSKSYATGNITGTIGGAPNAGGAAQVGGLVGASTGLVESSYATGNVDSAGGADVGGLVGKTTGKLTTSYALGNVIGGSNTGGLVGSTTALVSDTYATGSVTANTQFGGLIGASAFTGVAVVNSYATGKVAVVAGADVPTEGALIGSATGTIVNGYYNKDINATLPDVGAPSIVGGVTGKTTAELQTLSTFNTASTTVAAASIAGWDFTNIWAMYPGTMPLLKAAQKSLVVTVDDINQFYKGSAYTGLTPTYSYSITPTVMPTGTLALAGTYTTGVNVGAYSISASGLQSNQQYFVSYVDGKLNIMAAPATISLTGTRVYDGSANVAANIFSLNGLMTGESLTLSGVGTVTDKNVGNNKTVAWNGLALGDGAGGGLASNYTLVGGIQTASISKAALSLSASADSKIYDGTTASAVTAGTSGLMSGDTVSAVQEFTSKNVLGTGLSSLVISNGYSINDGNNGGNYTVTVNPAAVNGTITKAALSLSAVTDTKTYDGTMASAGIVSITGLAAGDTIIGAVQTFASKNVLGNNASTLVVGNSYALNDGNTGNNYTVSVNPTAVNGTISKAALSLSAVTDTKTYDGTMASAGIVSITGLASGDTLTGAVQTFASKNVLGNNASTLVVGNSYTLNDGNNNGDNYAVTVNPTAVNGTINKANLIISGATANTKIYDGTIAATLNGVAIVKGIGSDDVTATGSGTAAFADKNAGVAKVVNVSGYSLSGSEAGNYNTTGTLVTSGTINKLASATWTGGATGNWFNPANWASTANLSITGVVPDLSNVLDVIIPANVTISFNNTNVVLPADASDVFVNSIGTLGNLNMQAGNLNVANNLQLANLDQSGGVITGAANVTVNRFNQTAGVINTSGNFTVTDAFAQAVPPTGTGTIAVGGNININQTTGDLGTFNSLAGNNITLTANAGAATLGNVTAVGTLNVTALNNISQTAGTAVVVGGVSTLTSTAPADIILTNASNDFKNTVNANGRNVSITDLNALTVALNATGNSVLIAGGNLVISGNTTDLTTTTTNNGTTTFGNTTVRRNLNVTSAGAVSKTGVLTVGGTTAATAGGVDVSAALIAASGGGTTGGGTTTTTDTPAQTQAKSAISQMQGVVLAGKSNFTSDSTLSGASNDKFSFAEPIKLTLASSAEISLAKAKGSEANVKAIDVDDADKKIEIGGSRLALLVQDGGMKLPLNMVKDEEEGRRKK